MVISSFKMANKTESVISEKYQIFTEQLTKYAGIPLYILCFYGTTMNIIIFSQRIYRHRSGSLYLLFAAICDCLYLNIGPLANILQYGFHFNWNIRSIVFCKIKSYLLFALMANSATLTCFASINQYVLSSKKHKRWKFSSKKIALRCIVLTIIIWSIASSPLAVCYTQYSHSSENEQLVCTNSLQNTFCLLSQIFHICLIHGFLYPFLMLFLGIRTYRNIHQIHQKSLLKSAQIRYVNYQITLVLILQSIKSSLTSLPFAFFNSYILITMKYDKSLFSQMKETLVGQLTYLLFWSNYTSFFLYMHTSTIFKEQWKRIMKKIFCCSQRK